MITELVIAFPKNPPKGIDDDNTPLT